MHHRLWWLTTSEDYGSNIKYWRSEDRFLMDTFWRIWRLEIPEETRHSFLLMLHHNFIWSLWRSEEDIRQIRDTKVHGKFKRFIPFPCKEGRSVRSCHPRIIQRRYAREKPEMPSNGHIIHGYIRKWRPKRRITTLSLHILLFVLFLSLEIDLKSVYTLAYCRSILVNKTCIQTAVWFP